MKNTKDTSKQALTKKIYKWSRIAVLSFGIGAFFLTNGSIAFAGNAYKVQICDENTCSMPEAKTLAAPTLNSVTKSGKTSMIAKWKKVSDADGYEIYVKNSSNGTYKLAKKTSKTQFTFSNLKKGKTYSYKVCAYKNTGTKKLANNKEEKITSSDGKTIKSKYSNVKSLKLPK